MSVIDLIVGLLMLWAVFNGWRQGLILQLCSLAGIVLGVGQQLVADSVGAAGDGLEQAVSPPHRL